MTLSGRMEGGGGREREREGGGRGREKVCCEALHVKCTIHRTKRGGIHSIRKIEA